MGESYWHKLFSYHWTPLESHDFKSIILEDALGRMSTISPYQPSSQYQLQERQRPLSFRVRSKPSLAHTFPEADCTHWLHGRLCPGSMSRPHLEVHSQKSTQWIPLLKTVSPNSCEIMLGISGRWGSFFVPLSTKEPGQGFWDFPDSPHKGPGRQGKVL